MWMLGGKNEPCGIISRSLNDIPLSRCLQVILERIGDISNPNCKILVRCDGNNGTYIRVRKN